MRIGLFISISCIVVVSSAAKPSALERLPHLLDTHYPQMESWGRAGVIETEIETDARTTLTLAPGEDLIAAATVENRTIVLETGVYPLSQTLQLADHVIIRGTGAGRTKLVVKLHAQQFSSEEEKPVSITGVSFSSVEGAGIENLTITMDEPLPSPKETDEQDDLNVTLVRFTKSQNSWLRDCELLNVGADPLVMENSRHLTIEGTQIRGSHDKVKMSGYLILAGSESCLLSGLDVQDINHVILGKSTTGSPSRYNVITYSRFTSDIRFLDSDTNFNLLQNCTIAVPSWHHTPPISHTDSGNQNQNTNLLYLCTITRNFSSGGRSFSVADNPNRVYRLLKTSTLKTAVEEAGPTPHSNTLWPVRYK